jgi:hypothetical protein
VWLLPVAKIAFAYAFCTPGANFRNLSKKTAARLRFNKLAMGLGREALAVHERRKRGLPVVADGRISCSYRSRRLAGSELFEFCQFDPPAPTWPRLGVSLGSPPCYRRRARRVPWSVWSRYREAPVRPNIKVHLTS